MGDLLVNELGAFLVDAEGEAVFEDEDAVVVQIDAHREGELRVGKQILEEAFDGDVILRLEDGGHHLEVFFRGVHLEEGLLRDDLDGSGGTVEFVGGVHVLDLGVVVARVRENEGVRLLEADAAILVLAGSEQGDLAEEARTESEHHDDKVLVAGAQDVVGCAVIRGRDDELAAGRHFVDRVPRGFVIANHFLAVSPGETDDFLQVVEVRLGKGNEDAPGGVLERFLDVRGELVKRGGVARAGRVDGFRKKGEGRGFGEFRDRVHVV